MENTEGDTTSWNINWLNVFLYPKNAKWYTKPAQNWKSIWERGKGGKMKNTKTIEKIFYEITIHAKINNGWSGKRKIRV